MISSLHIETGPGMTIRKSAFRLLILLVLAAGLAGCGGGGGSKDDSAAESTTYTATVTGIELRLQSNDNKVGSGGVPLNGATVTRKP